MSPDTEAHDTQKWYALRDLKRPNAKQPAYKLLDEVHHIEIFTPRADKLITVNGKKVKVKAPILPDLLFAHSTTDHLSPIIDATPTLQYRYRKGGAYCEPIVVPEKQMTDFIQAVGHADSVLYFSPDEVTPQMVGQRIRIVGGIFNGCEGRLLKIKGSKVKRLLVELEGLLMAGVKIEPEFIQIVKSEE